MFRDVIAITVLTLLASAPDALQPRCAAAQGLPVRAELVAITGTTVEYVLSNDSPRIVTAWAVDITGTDSVGQTGVHQQITDMYITLAVPDDQPLAVDSGVLAPRASRRLASAVGVTPGAILSTAEVRVVAAVFEDGSSAGAWAIIDDVFARRAAERDAYAALLGDLRVARAKGGLQEHLEEVAVKARKRREDHPLAANIAEGVLQNLDIATTRLRSGGGDARAALDALERMIAREYTAAVKHASPAR